MIKKVSIYNMCDFDTSFDIEPEIKIVFKASKNKTHIFSTWAAATIKLSKTYGKPNAVTRRDGKISGALWIVDSRVIKI